MKRLLLTAIVLLSLVGYAHAGEPVIVPGERVGNFTIGMTRQQVLKMAPNPQENRLEKIIYENPRTGNSLWFNMKDNKVESIAFTNTAWSTASGINTANYDSASYAPFMVIRMLHGPTYYYATGDLMFWTRAGHRWGMVGHFPTPVGEPISPAQSSLPPPPITQPVVQPVAQPTFQVGAPTLQQFRKLQIGMTQEDVRRLLGEPMQVIQNSANNVRWVMNHNCDVSRGLKQCSSIQFYTKSNCTTVPQQMGSYTYDKMVCTDGPLQVHSWTE